LELAVLTLAARMTLDATAFTQTPAVTPTPLPPTPTPTSIFENCDRAEILTGSLSNQISYVTIGSLFEQSWSIRNVGTCTWNPNYTLELTSGEFLGGTTIIIPSYVRPGQTVDLTTMLIAPSQPGNYVGQWLMRNAENRSFGFGPNGNNPLVMQVVVGESPAGNLYDFAQNYCAAQWRSARGQVPCSGIVNEENGQVIFLQNPTLESSVIAGPSLWTIPNQANNGWISGTYPPIFINPGNRLKAQVGCLAGSPGCDVLFQIEYAILDGPTFTLGGWREVYDGQMSMIDMDLSFLAGQPVRFTFTVRVQNNAPESANAVWVRPRIE